MTPRALGGGLAAPAREEVYVRSYADTLRVVRLHAAEMDRAAVARDEGHELQAWLRERGAERALSQHTRGLREQHGAKLAAEWLDRAKAEATAPPAPPVCEAPAPKPAPRKRTPWAEQPRAKGETRAERSARNKAAWAAHNRGEAAK